VTILSPLGFATQKGATRNIATTILLTGAVGTTGAGNVNTIVSAKRKLSPIGFNQQARNFSGKGAGSVEVTLTGAQAQGQAEELEGAHIAFYPDGAAGLGEGGDALGETSSMSPGQFIERAGLTREDQANWDGVAKVTSRIDETGGRVTSLTIGECVDVVQVFGGARDITTIAAALRYIGTDSNVTLLWEAGKWLITSDVTIPANFANHVPAGCVFEISTGATLTFSGPVNVEHSTGWFTGNDVVCSLGASGFPGW